MTSSGPRGTVSRVGALGRGPTYMRVTTPANLDLALEGLVRKVLREQPKQEDIYAFAAEYFETLVEIRDRAENPNAQPSEICPNHSDAEASSLIKMATAFARPAYEIKSLPKKPEELPSTDDQNSEHPPVPGPQVEGQSNEGNANEVHEGGCEELTEGVTDNQSLEENIGNVAVSVESEKWKNDAGECAEGSGTGEEVTANEDVDENNINSPDVPDDNEDVIVEKTDGDVELPIKTHSDTDEILPEPHTEQVNDDEKVKNDIHTEENNSNGNASVEMTGNTGFLNAESSEQQSLNAVDVDSKTFILAEKGENEDESQENEQDIMLEFIEKEKEFANQGNDMKILEKEVHDKIKIDDESIANILISQDEENLQEAENDVDEKVVAVDASNVILENKKGTSVDDDTGEFTEKTSEEENVPTDGHEASESTTDQKSLSNVNNDECENSDKDKNSKQENPTNEINELKEQTGGTRRKREIVVEELESNAENHVSNEIGNATENDAADNKEENPELVNGFLSAFAEEDSNTVVEAVPNVIPESDDKIINDVEKPEEHLTDELAERKDTDDRSDINQSNIPEDPPQKLTDNLQMPEVTEQEDTDNQSESNQSNNPADQPQKLADDLEIAEKSQQKDADDQLESNQSNNPADQPQKTTDDLEIAEKSEQKDQSNNPADQPQKTPNDFEIAEKAEQKDADDQLDNNHSNNPEDQSQKSADDLEMPEITDSGNTMPSDIPNTELMDSVCDPSDAELNNKNLDFQNIDEVQNKEDQLLSETAENSDVSKDAAYKLNNIKEEDVSGEPVEESAVITATNITKSTAEVSAAESDDPSEVTNMLSIESKQARNEELVDGFINAFALSDPMPDAADSIKPELFAENNTDVDDLAKADENQNEDNGKNVAEESTNKSDDNVNEDAENKITLNTIGKNDELEISPSILAELVEKEMPLEIPDDSNLQNETVIKKEAVAAVDMVIDEATKKVAPNLRESAEFNQDEKDIIEKNYEEESSENIKTTNENVEEEKSQTPQENIANVTELTSKSESTGHPMQHTAEDENPSEGVESLEHEQDQTQLDAERSREQEHVAGNDNISKQNGEDEFTKDDNEKDMESPEPLTEQVADNETTKEDGENENSLSEKIESVMENQAFASKHTSVEQTDPQVQHNNNGASTSDNIQPINVELTTSDNDRPQCDSIENSAIAESPADIKRLSLERSNSLQQSEMNDELNKNNVDPSNDSESKQQKPLNENVEQSQKSGTDQFPKETEADSNQQQNSERTNTPENSPDNSEENPFISAEVKTNRTTFPVVDSQETEDESDVIVPLNADIGTIEELDEDVWKSQVSAVRAAIIIQKNYRKYLQRMKKAASQDCRIQNISLSGSLSENPDNSKMEDSSTESTTSSNENRFGRFDTAIENTKNTQDSVASSKSPRERLKQFGEANRTIDDSALWETLERELDVAAITIQQSYKEYKNRQKERLRREDAMQLTSGTSEDSTAADSPLPSRLMHSGELHDVLIPEESNYIT